MRDNTNSEGNGQLSEKELIQFNLYANAVVDFNSWLIAGSVTDFDRPGLGISATELLYDLLERWARNNNTFGQWTHAESKDFGRVIFIHCYYEPENIMLHIGMNDEGIYLQMTVAVDVLAGVTVCLNEFSGKLSRLGDFCLEPGEGDLCIMWPYDCYSVLGVSTNGATAFKIMYDLIRVVKPVS